MILKTLKILIILFPFLCSSQKTDVIKEKDKIDQYVNDIRLNDDLIQSISEGEIYNKKNKIIGGFSYYEYFPSSKNQLYRLEYNLNTDFSIHEDYFYKNNEVIYIEQQIYYPKKNESDSIILYFKNGEILEVKEPNSKMIELINNANKYLKEFLEKDK